MREVLYQDGVLDVFYAREEKKSRVHFLCGIFVQNASVFSPCFVISVNLLYLLGRDDSRAENSHEEHEGINVHVCEISGAFRGRRRRYVSLFFLFLSVFSFYLKRLNFGISLYNIHERSKMGKKISGAQKRKKKREKEELAADMERLKLGPTELWTGLVVHHKDVFVSHVISKLNGTDRFFFSEVNIESRGVLTYAGVDVSKLCVSVHECTSISTLEWSWNHVPWGEKDIKGNVVDQAYFCALVAATNKLEFLKWTREVKHCEWDEWTINATARTGNL